MPRVITSTYRLQLTRDFPVSEARRLVPYFHQLGISHLYLSPLLAAKAGSAHGYDVIDHARVNHELGTDDEVRALAHELHALGMGIVLDIVPNHMAACAENRQWDDVLERGRASRFADWFDVEWDAPFAAGKIVLPVLGDELARVMERGELQVRIRDTGARIAYFENTFPLDPATLPREFQLALWDPAGRPAVDDWAAAGTPAGHARLRDLLDHQHYRLAFWRDAEAAANYRRFFDVNDLVALRQETEEVFDATHALVLDWVRHGVVDGLRVDHIDGLRLPSWYLAKLRQSVDAVRHADAPARFPILVEKILATNEQLPAEWPVEGTTGYDFLNEVEDLFIDAEGWRAIETAYRRMRRAPESGFRALAREGKRSVLQDALAPDVQRAARLAHRWSPETPVDDLGAAIVELIVHLDVYRTYVAEPGILGDSDRRVLTAAFSAARACEGEHRAALGVLERAFFDIPAPGDVLRAELVTRLQQTSGPAMAKGVEDTALYTYVPLASRNEVGGDPDRAPDDAVERLHARNAARAGDWPHGMLATNTHDTKRSADIRSRLDVLTADPARWSRYVARWRRLNKGHKRVVNGRPAPDTNTEYLYYQTLAAFWPAPRPARRVDDLPDRQWRAQARERLLVYMLKAAREAKVRTTWTESHTEYERALDGFVHATLEAHEDLPFLSDVARLTALIAPGGFRNAFARIVLHFASPGVPDVYRGTELWNFTFVDPDNRRPVDFERRAGLLAELDTEATLRDAAAATIPLSDDRVKLALTARLGRFRRDHADLVRHGDYRPVLSNVHGIFAFHRRHHQEECIAIVRTRPLPTGKEEAPPRTAVIDDELAGAWFSVLTGRRVELIRTGPQLTAWIDDLVPPPQPGELLFRAKSGMESSAQFGHE
jgi:(1->4)-alpha-D-glucan 1-alpha-D-glucosylmutase